MFYHLTFLAGQPVDTTEIYNHVCFPRSLTLVFLNTIAIRLFFSTKHHSYFLLNISSSSFDFPYVWKFSIEKVTFDII